MQLEVTKKEAIEIYIQRYGNSKSKLKRNLPGILFFIAAVGSFAIMSLGHDWLGVGIFIAISLPIFIFIFKDIRASKRFALSQVEG